ncbi:unnamed protein product [Soboliphyme baturini]|uniref:GOLD domain-containing protein n=1 Tax=Soboliphyme baturini TaxID=241478 RepID=A0A183IG66_9BILA|nr:unnamed protein product [Soboliphyme baturini]
MLKTYSSSIRQASFRAILILLWPCLIFALTAQQVITGEVVAGNYSYFRITKEGSLALILFSYEGDVDLYVSSSVSSPTYEFGWHDFKSASCGVDHVEIESRIKRPVFVGIYGYSQNVLNRFVLVVSLFDPHDEHVSDMWDWVNSLEFTGDSKTVLDLLLKKDKTSLQSTLLYFGEMIVSFLLFILDVLAESFA